MQFAALTPEIYCSDFSKSFAFYTNTLGFSVVYQTPEHRFAYLERQGAQLMIQELTPESEWITEKPTYPFGRGMSFKIYTTHILELNESLQRSGQVFFEVLKDTWYQKDQSYIGNRQFIIQDPDGYFLRFAEDLGTKPAPEPGL